MAGAGTVAGKQSASARFFQSEATGSILLLICTLVALGWANSPWSDSYRQLLASKLGFSWNDSKFVLSWDHWINDGLMAVFFFVVGLEIKREVVVGHLSTWRRAILPVAAGAGGMIVPALIYSAFNSGGEGAHGWGIPMATDIAFALGILALLGPMVPTGLKVFLTALAIADDLGAVLVIALFYSDRILVLPLAAAGLLLGAIVIAGRMNIRSIAVYGVLVVAVWLAIFASGIHATVSGILLAMVVPVRARVDSRGFFAIARERLAALEASGFGAGRAKLSSEEIEDLEELHRATSDAVPAGTAFERYLHPVTAYVVLPLFALFNAGVEVDYKSLGYLAHPVGLGVALGLLIGKQLGITGASWIVIRSRLADMPANVTWKQIWGGSLLAGIGFTMALFVSDLAFGDPQMRQRAKLSILVASAVCAAAGYQILRSALKKASEAGTSS
jgi:NhaA family Na+:H+ antiporter